MRLFPLVALAAVAFAIGGHAHAQPGFPASFHGAVAVDGKPVPDGTEVRGFINGIDCTQLGDNYRKTLTIDGVSQYAIEVVHQSQKDGCGDAGRMVTFTVGGVPARETSEWKAGVTEVNLNVGAGTGPTLPPPTATATLEPTQVAQTATEAAQFTPIPGTPPTDEITPPGGTTGPTRTPAPPTSGVNEGNDGGGGAFVLAAVVIALLFLGVVGGTLLGRRRGQDVSDP
jgi:hypothetical protein